MFNFFKRNKPQAKNKPIQQQLLELPLGSFVVLSLNPDICAQHILKGTNRFDEAVISTNKLKGLVKAVYVADTTNYVYVEVVGLVVSGGVATRKEYVVMQGEILSIKVCDV
jgi:hypothetical protein